MLLSTLHVVLTLLLLVTTVSADCFNDNNWNIALVNKKTYWATVNPNGQQNLLVTAPCLDQETRGCVSCSTVATDRMMIPNDILPCQWAARAAAYQELYYNHSSTTIANATIITEAAPQGPLKGETTINFNPPRYLMWIRCAYEA